MLHIKKIQAFFKIKLLIIILCCAIGNISNAQALGKSTVIPGDDCTFNGQTVLNGDSVTAYENASVPGNQSCISESRTCSFGVLSGSYGYAACTVARSGDGDLLN